MTRRMRRRFTSLGFGLRKAYRKLTTAKPSIFIIALLVASLAVFLLGGGVYDILEKPLIAFPISQTRILFFYPYSLHEQAISESLYIMVSYAIGAVGLLLMYQSTKYAYKPRQAFIMLLAGVAFMLMAYFFIENLIWSKMTVTLPAS